MIRSFASTDPSLGFGARFEEDLWAVRCFSKRTEIVVATSYSKNFTLYGERVGSMHFTVHSAEVRTKILSELSYYSRAEVSTSPIFGASVINTILSTPDLKRQWLSELEFISNRVKVMRRALFNAMHDLGTLGDWSFVLTQTGMFSYTGFNLEEVMHLREVVTERVRGNSGELRETRQSAGNKKEARRS